MITTQYLGFITLYKKEVFRFLKVYNQTLLAPVITSLLFLAVFSLSLGHHVTHIGTIPFHMFMGSGLIIMSMVQNAFANSSSSFIMGKVLGNIIDILMPPLSAGDIVTAYVLASITRGLLVGLLVGLSMLPFLTLTIYSIGWLLLYAVLACMLLGLLGLFGGIFSESFDQMAAITSYIITPLSFLSGTFYSVKQLPHFWYVVSTYNPFFYMIDGFRYAMTGYHDGSLIIGLITLSVSNMVMWVLVYMLIKRGYRIKQ